VNFELEKDFGVEKFNLLKGFCFKLWTFLSHRFNDFEIALIVMIAKSNKQNDISTRNKSMKSGLCRKAPL